MGRGSRVLAGALLLALSVSACGGQDPRPVASPGEVPGERVSTDNALPGEFPGDFPLPPQRTVMYSAVSAVGVVVYFNSEIRGDALTNFLRGSLRDREWTVHSCLRTESGPEPMHTIVASKGRKVATAVVGYAPDAASRIQGRVYTFFVSVALDAAPPVTGTDSC